MEEEEDLTLTSTKPQTPVYMEGATAVGTPEPQGTPLGDRTETPEPAHQESDVDSVDSETKGQPLVQHFEDEEEDVGRLVRYQFPVI